MSSCLHCNPTPAVIGLVAILAKTVLIPGHSTPRLGVVVSARPLCLEKSWCCRERYRAAELSQSVIVALIIPMSMAAKKAPMLLKSRREQPDKLAISKRLFAQQR